MPQVSVILPTHDRLPLLPRAIQSVIAQTREDWELLIVDDGSKDGTHAWLQDLQKNWKHLQPLKIITTPNQGVSAARNRGAQSAHGEWLAFLDSDDEWLPQKTELQLALTLQAPLIHGNEIWWREDEGPPRQVRQQAKHAKSGGQVFRRCVDMCCIAPSATMIRADLFEELKGFRQDFAVCEDYELWLRVSAHHSVAFVDTPILNRYGGRADQLSSKFHSMDRWRVKALAPFLESSLAIADRIYVAQSMFRRCEILLKGQSKRGEECQEIRAWQDQARRFLTTHHIDHSAIEVRPRSVAGSILNGRV